MKKITHFKRILAMAVVVVLLIGCLSTSVFAAKEMFTTYEITNVTIIGIDAPKAGEKFDFTAEENSQKYNIIKVAWQAQYRDDYITSTSSTAAAGTKYTVFVVLEVATPEHYFKTGEGRVSAVPSVTINGNTAAQNNAQDYSLFSIDASKYEHDTTYQKYLTVSYTFPATEAQTSVKDVAVLNVTEPASGEKPDFNADTPTGCGYYVSKIRWYKSGSNTDMTSSDKFESGQKYYAFIEITAESTYSFWAYNYMSGTVNGVKALGFTADGTVSKITMMAEFTATGAPVIYNIDIKDVKAPIAGSAPTYSATLASSGYVSTGRSDAYYKNGMCWSVNGGSYLAASGQAFAPRTEYQVDIRLKPASGYQFATKTNGSIDLTATVNGKAATVSGNKNEIVVTYVFPETENIAISKVGVTDIDAPVTGNSPDYEASYSNVNYGAADYNDKTNKNGISWYNETDKKTMSTSDKFEAGKVYTVQIMIWTNDGYEFQYKSGSVNIAGTVNGKSAEVSSRNNEEVTLYYTFPKTEEHKCSPKKIDEVKATCKEEGKKSYYFCPECGKNFEDSKCTKEITDINAWGKIEKLEHTGGKATCDNRAICKNCGEWYGEFAEHKFGTAWDYKDETGHAHKCKECGINDTIVPHSGGISKCGETAKCSECKAEYGEVIQHQWSKTPEYTDKNGHAYKCTVCGEHDTVVAHSGGTADCKNKAKCSVCGTEYGKVGDHKWSAQWDYTDAKGHAHKCSVCGEHDDVVKHTPGAAATETASQNCTVCGYTIAPATTHKHKLVRMDAVKATCTEPGMKSYYYCQSCDSIFTNNTDGEEITDKDSLVIPATGHKESKWKYDADVHWKECTVKGCDAIIDGTNEGHDFSEKDKCTVCGYKRGDAITEEPTQAESETDEPTTGDTSDDTGNSPDSSQNGDTSDSAEKQDDDNAFMWIIIAAVAVAVVCVALTAVVLVKKKGKK
ncbi:MAG: hypothetical protein IJY93_05560 [Clostridia bacterium]|nr:hypothetical protein [Clostridia bacterium]